VTAASSGRGAADISAAVAELELDQEHAGAASSRSAASSAAVAELELEHAGEHDRGGDRRRGGADRGELGPGRGAADISAAVAELD
jgi:hypothetical protein